MKSWMTLREAAAETPYGEQTLRKCVNMVRPLPGALPPLDAGRDKNGRIIISDKQLTDWMQRILNN